MDKAQDSRNPDNSFDRRKDLRLNLGSIPRGYVLHYSGMQGAVYTSIGTSQKLHHDGGWSLGKFPHSPGVKVENIFLRISRKR